MNRGSLHHKKYVDRFRRLGVRPVDFVRAAEIDSRAARRQAPDSSCRDAAGTARLAGPAR